MSSSFWFGILENVFCPENILKNPHQNSELTLSEVKNSWSVRPEFFCLEDEEVESSGQNYFKNDFWGTKMYQFRVEKQRSKTVTCRLYWVNTAGMLLASHSRYRDRLVLIGRYIASVVYILCLHQYARHIRPFIIAFHGNVHILVLLIYLLSYKCICEIWNMEIQETFNEGPQFHNYSCQSKQ